MARGAQKRVSQANQRAVATLAYGFLVSNTLFVLAACLRRQTSPWRTWTLYGITEFLAALIAWKLVAMAQVGDDLSLPGMTAYVKESSYSQVYVRLCVHYMVCARRCCTRITAVLVDLCGGMFLFFFFFRAPCNLLMQIPMYLSYLFYKNVFVPYILPRLRPVRHVSQGGYRGTAPSEDKGTSVSKRQAKMQARQARGGGVRVQTRRG